MRPPRLRWVILFTLAGVCLGALWTSYSYELARMHRLTTLLDRKMTALTQLQRKLESTREQLRYVQTEEGLAEIARRDYNMLGPDERLFWLDYGDSQDEALHDSRK